MKVYNDIGKHWVEVVYEKPPVYDMVASIFPIRGKKVYFAYFDKVYSPSGEIFPVELVDHEALHLFRQHQLGPDIWWRRYCTDPEFRLEEEILAHTVELKQRLRMVGDNRAARRKWAAVTAMRLANPIYGSMITKAEALKILKKEITA